MIRRKFMILLFGLMLVPGAAAADDIKDLVVQQLAQAGFTEIRVVKTWLGRWRFEAENDAYMREIVVNPRTGEVLRDIWREIGEAQPGIGLFERDSNELPEINEDAGGQSSSGSNGSGASRSSSSDDDDSSDKSRKSGSSSDDEDEEDEEDDDDEEDEIDEEDEKDDDDEDDD